MNSTGVIEIRLLGQKISLRVNHEDPELVEEVVDLATSLLTEAENKAKGTAAAPHQVALVALLNLAEEYVVSKRRVSEHQSEVSKKSRAVLELLK